MNAVEIEEAVSKLVEESFNAAEFAYAFLEAFGNKTATLQRLRSVGKNSTNKTDLSGDGIHAVLQRNNIHIATCATGGTDAVAGLLKRLVDSPASSKHKAKFALATDGNTVHAECLNSEEPPLVCEFKELADHFGYFLELAGISTVRQIRENAFDIKATGRLNRLYVELLRNNPDWDGDDRREELNHFFARLIFCFFAEDTGIFSSNARFTETVRQMSAPSGENTDFVLSEVFRAMDVPMKERDAAKLRPWAGQFPYVNGGLFGSNGTEDARSTVPKFTQIARSYLLHVGSLDWTQINPDIFGSMIQAVADDEERGALGMHYTSVPNILKVLNPLFLDDLHEQLKEAGKNPRKLLNLRKRLARIRVFDPACGSGNFLVIAYKEMRKIEAEINILRGEPDRASEIPLTNFRGIELRHFAVEIARLALIIAEYQCDELYRGQRLALAEFLPLNKENWITHGNALRLDWLKVCPPTGTGVKLVEDDLFQTPLDQIEMDFENEGGETYICGNPPYYGSRRQEKEQKADLKDLASDRIKKWKSLDYVGGWLLKASDYMTQAPAFAAFVCTSSVSEGLQVGLLWPSVLGRNKSIFFAHRPFKWSNLAKSNAGVTVVVVGIKPNDLPTKVRLYEGSSVREVVEINPYLVPATTVYVDTAPRPLSNLQKMITGSMPRDGGSLLLTLDEAVSLRSRNRKCKNWIRRYVGTNELIKGIERYCLWITDETEAKEAAQISEIAQRFASVEIMRSESPLESTQEFSDRPYRFVYLAGESKRCTIAVGGVSSELRPYLPVDLLPPTAVVSNLALAIYDGALLNVALIASHLHLVWIAAVCGKLETRYRYSNTLGWNTFPVPKLTDEDRSNLNNCAEEILIAREAHWPATIADLYDPEKMPDDLRAAHDRNDETLERIYIGRRFRNDTERLETLFQLYTEMTGKGKGKK
ncbi:MAG TPA: lactate dehydrogenase [Planctomycetaceae bacterium]|nr:lactate dehydrogenase [Planctomycetaceae bacterium]